jgi:hypothetical protein
MRRIFLFLSIPAAAAVFALLARPGSLGIQLQSSAEVYSSALSAGNPSEARVMMAPEIARQVSDEFLARLEGTEVPHNFGFDGVDAVGFRMTGTTGETGTRVIWFSALGGEILVTGDTALDNILGSAAILCRENAAAQPDGCCPVSGAPYRYNLETGLVVCPEDHLGTGIVINSNSCSLSRDSVSIELSEYLEAGFEYPETPEEMFTLSGGMYGRRGGYRCPDNGYKYYELRDGAIYCPFHEESSEAAVEL